MEYHLENIDNIEDYKKYRAKLSKKRPIGVKKSSRLRMTWDTRPIRILPIDAESLLKL